MTEADLAVMEAIVLGTPQDPAFLLQWTQDALVAVRRQEQALMADWKLAKFLRDDARLTTLAGDLQKVRAAIGYLSASLPT